MCKRNFNAGFNSLNNRWLELIPACSTISEIWYDLINLCFSNRSQIKHFHNIMWHKIWWSFIRHRNIFSKWCPNIDKKLIEPFGNIITISIIVLSQEVGWRANDVISVIKATRITATSNKCRHSPAVRGYQIPRLHGVNTTHVVITGDYS